MSIKPGIVLSDGTTYYPSGFEWILAFALRDCQWAIDILEKPEVKEEMRLCYLRRSDPIETIWGVF